MLLVYVIFYIFPFCYCFKNLSAFLMAILPDSTWDACDKSPDELTPGAGLYTGLKCVITTPIEQTKNEGALGLVKGICQGKS